jgi:citrate synthase
MDHMLETEEAARRLGVKAATLYAYVSRGLIEAVRTPDGRRSLFAVEDVERLARRGRGGRQVETRLATVTTSVTQIRKDGPWYRGVRATDLAGRDGFEAVAERLWQVEPGAWEADVGVVPAALRSRDRLAWAVVMAGAADPVRSDLRAEAVVPAARRVVASMVAALGGDPTRPGQPATVAESLFRTVFSTASTLPAANRAVSPESAVPAVPAVSAVSAVHAVDAALVLLADHELATSTMAVRIAASTRASVYDAVLAGLGTIAGPLHGAASALAWRLLSDVEERGAGRAVDDALRWSRHLPGFGHPVYRHGDPRATVLLTMLEQAVPDATSIRAVDEVTALAAERGMPEPNIDLALAALVRVVGAAPEAGQVLFTVARVAGWVAHYLEELDQAPLRFRARAVYAKRSTVAEIG